jgi:hypothetical protein
MRSSVTARRRMLCSTDSDNLTVGSPAPALRIACTSCTLISLGLSARSS